MEASFCDVWPLATGNWWYDGSGVYEVSDQKTYNGQTVWHMRFTMHGVAHDDVWSGYWVFADGWLYGTENEADLAVLPQIGDGMYRVFPEVFRDGDTFISEGLVSRYVAGVYELTAVVTDGGVVVHLPGYDFGLTLVRGKGIANPMTRHVEGRIVGTCSGLYETQVSTASPQWVTVGQPVRLAVPASSGQGLQWYKDGVVIEGASTSTYLKTPAAMEDAGSYTCRISDGAKGFHDTKPVIVEVFAEGALPVAGTAGLAALALVLTAMSYAGIRKAHNK